jgi:sugar phosphate isomerase/epimerase
LNVGISTASFYPEYLTEETIPFIGEMGINIIEVFLESYSEYDLDYCKRMKDTLDKYNIIPYSVHALGSQFEPQLFAATERQRNDAKKLYEKVLKAANILGAKVYVFHGPPNNKNKFPVLDFEKIGKITSELADMAGQYDIRFSWENVFWCWFSFPEFAKNLVQASNSKNLYFTFDIKQAMKSRKDPMDFLKAMGNKITNVHLCDFDDRGKLYLPGEGSFDFKVLNYNLDIIGYKGPVIMEVYRFNYNHYKEMLNSIKFLKNIFEKEVDM